MLHLNKVWIYYTLHMNMNLNFCVTLLTYQIQMWIADALYNFTDGNFKVLGPNATAGIWSTYPTEGISQGNGVGDQVFGTFLLLMCIRGITDEKNAKLPGYLAPFIVGLCVLNIGICFGYNCGYAINPARDLGPRIFTLMCGFGTDTFR